MLAIADGSMVAVRGRTRLRNRPARAVEPETPRMEPEEHQGAGLRRQAGLRSKARVATTATAERGCALRRPFDLR
jgi:hypothetical protein